MGRVGAGVNERTLQQHLRASFSEENEACECKEFKNLKHAVTGGAGNDIASYVSAIANMEGGHLVIGVKDRTLDIVGIRALHDFTKENICPRLVGFCANLNSENFRVDEFMTTDTGRVVWVFHIPKHDPRLPVYAHGKAWQRIGDSLVSMRSERLSTILLETVETVDWSATIIDDAVLTDLDEEALAKARDKFKERNTNAAWHEEIDKWDWPTLLDKAKLTVNGKLTRAAILLLGKDTPARHHLSPHPAQITWKLEGDDPAYEHFGPPFILTTSEVLKRIRNVPQKLFPKNQLLAVEVPKYDTRVILEGLHNCLAHQDYERQERITITEKPDRLVFENAGSFFEGEVEDYLRGTQTPRRYRNQWLAQAMVQVSMIDTMGYGIHIMTESQRSRYLPLPDFSKSTETSVVLEVLGRPIDENYSQLLLGRRDLDIDTVILLDRIQKRLPITETAARLLRRNGLIEGRKPNYHVSAQVAVTTDAEVAYTRSRGVEKAQLKELVRSHLKKFMRAVRPDIDSLLFPLLSDDLTDDQKRNKITNLLSEMKRKDHCIQSTGRGPGAEWTLVEKSASAGRSN